MRFAWTYIQPVIHFNCSVNKPENGVYFKDSDGSSVAHCLIVPVSSCYSKVAYGQIVYDNSTNTTVFTVNAEKRFVNGNWSCSNGIGNKDPNLTLTVKIRKHF